MTKSRRRQGDRGRASARISESTVVAPVTAGWSRNDWGWALALVVAVAITYQAVWNAEFVWDDGFYIVHNRALTGWSGLVSIWTTSAADVGPLTFTAFWIEHALWGFAPGPFHWVNILLQGINAVLLWRILRSLGVRGAWLGAALWALHPVQVETVAWVIELKNTLSGLFFLLAAQFFIKYINAADLEKRPGSLRFYILCLVFAVLAMAAKSSTIILPLVLYLIAWWLGSRRYVWNGIRMLPLCVAGVVCMAASLWAEGQEAGHVVDPNWVRTWPQRIVSVGDEVWFYLGKLVWPHPLMSIYPRWQIDAGQVISYLPTLAVIVALIFFWLKRDAWARPWFFAFVYFLMALLPVLGFVDNMIFMSSFVFDHLQYLASMGPLALAGAGISIYSERLLPQGMPWRFAPATVVLLVLALITWNRAAIFKNDMTLWTDAEKQNPKSWAAHYDIGWMLLNQGKVDPGVAECENALAIAPNYGEAHNALGVGLATKGQIDEAEAQFQEAIRDKAGYSDAHSNLGLIYEFKKQWDLGRAECEKAVLIDPYNANAWDNLGLAYKGLGQLDQAELCFEKALQVDPNHADAKKNLARLQAANQPAGANSN